MKRVGGLLIGISIAIAIVVCIEIISHKIYPLPENLDLSNPENVKKYMEIVPSGAILLVVLGHFIGLLVGNIISKLISKEKRSMWIISGLFLAMVVMNLFMVPHPIWFAVADISAIFLAFLIPFKALK